MPKADRKPSKQSGYLTRAVPRLTEEIRRRMIRGYRECAEENRQLAEEWLPLTLEVWPEWNGPLPEPRRRGKRRNPP